MTDPSGLVFHAQRRLEIKPSRRACRWPPSRGVALLPNCLPRGGPPGVSSVGLPGVRLPWTLGHRLCEHELPLLGSTLKSATPGPHGNCAQPVRTCGAGSQRPGSPLGPPAWPGLHPSLSGGCAVCAVSVCCPRDAEHFCAVIGHVCSLCSEMSLLHLKWVSYTQHVTGPFKNTRLCPAPPFSWCAEIIYISGTSSLSGRKSLLWPLSCWPPLLLLPGRPKDDWDPGTPFLL